MIIEDNFLTQQECEYWINVVIGLNPKYKLPFGADADERYLYNWDDRSGDITNHPIVNRVSQFLKNKYNYELTISDAKTQIWPVGCGSEMHIHNEDGRINTKYNTIIYLNNNFKGGNFYTNLDRDIIIKPVPGRLIHFDGSTLPHGLDVVLKHNRYSIIFWWKK